jgi:hypothetical protein
VNRHHNEAQSSFQLLDVLGRAATPTFVIADVTGGNPNVMYELGLRHSKAKATIQIGQRQRLPFDVAAIRTIIFPRTDGGLIEVRRQLVEALRAAQEWQRRFRFSP